MNPLYLGFSLRYVGAGASAEPHGATDSLRSPLTVDCSASRGRVRLGWKNERT